MKTVAAAIEFGTSKIITLIAESGSFTRCEIVGSGTVSNQDSGRGYSCIVEKRILEQIELGEARTPYLRYGETVRIEMLDRNGRSVFGAIEQEVLPDARISFMIPLRVL